MVTVEEVRKAQRAEGPATVMAIGTATPPNCVDQSTYPDYYFRITNSEHKVELKEKFKRMCKYNFILIMSILRICNVFCVLFVQNKFSVSQNNLLYMDLQHLPIFMYFDTGMARVKNILNFSFWK